MVWSRQTPPEAVVVGHTVQNHFLAVGLTRCGRAAGKMADTDFNIINFNVIYEQETGSSVLHGSHNRLGHRLNSVGGRG